MMGDRLLIVAGILLCVLSWKVDCQNLVRSRNDEADWRPRTRSTVCVPRDCKLPDCYCAGKTGPSHLRNYQIPQMVMLTFDDAINEQVFEFYEKLFDPIRKNPNGCPISTTFYLSHNWTNYDMVRELFNTGHEIASHSVTHRLPQSWWTHASLKDWYKEVEGQRSNIESKSGISKSKVLGMRVPFLELGGDKQFKMMKDVGITYDSSFMTGPYDEGGAWPFTLDYPPNWKYCSNNNCPKSSFPGVWELPMNRWIGPDGKPCPMVDACQTQPVDKEDALGYMWYNFNRFYRGNRAPFGIHLHAVWFKKDDSYVDALGSFLDALSDMDDVYLVSASQVVEWMKNPTTVKDINNFMPWRQSCLSPNNRNNPRTPPPQRPTTTKRTTTTTTATTTTTQRPTTTEPKTTTPVKKPLMQENPVEQDQQPVKPIQNVNNIRYEVNRPEQVGGQSRNNIPVWSVNQPTDRDNSIPDQVRQFDRPPHKENEPSLYKPEDQNMNQEAPKYNGPPHKDNFYPASMEEWGNKPQNNVIHQGDTQTEPEQPRSPWKSEPVLQENIQVNIDLGKEKELVTIAEDKPKQVITNEKVSSQQNTNEQNAYEASRGEGTSVDKPLYQSSLSAASSDHGYRANILAVTIVSICLVVLVH